ncbi:hypothetical protein SteCoe_13101 [Stentor coeruleus]|uniref:EF-hand domain-containing protein n=1 Tax=Stentor coeruleus TaxID=5963 RepID=A0A1R2C975_9CILI|nr:hypothetical protein SteCoe_13101 [Stentor coeruleus]
MDPKLQEKIYPFEILKKQSLNEINRSESPTISPLKSQSSFPNIHSRSSVQTSQKTNSLTRDVSHRMDSSMKLRSNFEQQEAKLYEILGIKQNIRKLPGSLQEIQSSLRESKEPDKQEEFLQDLEEMKTRILKRKEKLLQNVLNEGGLLYRTQSGLIQPQLTNLYDHILKKNKGSITEIPRVDLDLGVPSGRKEVEIIIIWLESMMKTYVEEPKDLMLEEKVKRAQLIYTTCFKEVIRQVSTQCLERGVLMQKIWNAHIDINCVKEDTRLNEIESLKKRLEAFMLTSGTRLKTEIEKYEKTISELKENIRIKDKEIRLLNMKIDETKAQAEREMIFYIGKQSKSTMALKMPIKLDERTYDNQDGTQDTKISNKIPVVMLGFFDNEGFFHKQKVIQPYKGINATKEYFDEVIRIVEYYEKETQMIRIEENFLTQEIQTEYDFCDRSVQYPDENGFGFYKQDDIAANLPEKVFTANFVLGRKSMIPEKIFIFSKNLDEGFSDSDSLNDEEDSENEKHKKRYVRSKSVSSSISRRGLLENIDSELPEGAIFMSKLQKDLENFSTKALKSASKSKSPSKNLKSKTLKPKRQVKTYPKKLQNPILENQTKKGPSPIQAKKPITEENSSAENEESEKSQQISEDEIPAKKPLIQIKPKKIPQRHSQVYKIKNIPKQYSSSSENSVNEIEKSQNSTPSIKSPKNRMVRASLPVNFISEKKSKAKTSRDDNKFSKQVRKISEIAEDNERGSDTSEDEVQVKVKNKGKIIRKSMMQYPRKKDSVFESLQNIKGQDDNQRDLKDNIKKLERTMTENRNFKVQKLMNIPENIENKSNKYCQTDHNGGFYKEQMLNQIVIMPIIQKILKDIFNDPTRKINLVKDMSFIKKTSELGTILVNLLPKDLFNIENQTPVEVENLSENKPCQTEEKEEAKIISSTDPEIPKALVPNTKAKTKKKSRNIHAASTIRSRKVLQNPPIEPLAKSQSASKSQNTLKSLKSHTKSKPIKTLVIPEEFALGQVSRKIILTHPGQKLLQQTINEIQASQNVRVEVNLKSLMKIINLVYTEKSSQSRENPNYAKYETCMILYDMLTNRYGLKIVAENKFKQIIHSSFYYKDSLLRIRNFAKFLGLEGDYQVEDWNFYLTCSDVIEGEKYGKNIFNEDTAVDHFSVLQRVIQCVHTIFDGKLPDGDVENIISKVVDMKNDDNTGMGKKSIGKNVIECVNTDKFMIIMLGFYRKIKDKIQEVLFEDLEKEEFVNEEEFRKLINGVKEMESEMLGKMFEKYCVNKRLDEEKVERAVKGRAVFALAFEYGITDIKELFK